MKILFSIIILICVVEFHRATACSTSENCTSDCDCNSCVRSNCCNSCQTHCHGCQTNCCNNCCSCCTKCCNNSTSTTTTPTTLTTSITTPTKPTPTTTRPTVKPSVDEANINIDIKNVINTTNDVKVPVEISLKNTNNVVSLLNMTTNSNCTTSRGCKNRTSTQRIIPTTPAPIYVETAEETFSTEEYPIQPLIPKPMPIPEPEWLRLPLPEADWKIPNLPLPNRLPEGPIYGQPIPYNQLQNIYNQYNQNIPTNVDSSQLSRMQSGYPYFGSNYNQFPSIPYSSSYSTQGLPYGSWPSQGYPYNTLTG